MTAYCVAYHADATLNVSCVGPFRSRTKAEKVCDRLTEVADKAAHSAHALPHVVTFYTEDEAIRKIEQAEQ